MNYQNTINNDFQLALITNDYIFFTNNEELDENANTKMYNKDMKLLSDNYFASDELTEIIRQIINNEIEPEFVSENMKYNIECFKGCELR